MSVRFDENYSPLVLLVEATPEDCQTLASYLIGNHQPAFRVQQASSIAQALTQVAAERPDGVLLQSNLTEGDGIALLRQLVTAYGLHAFGLVLLTGSGDAAVAVQAMKEGAHDCVQKTGLTPTRLRRTMDNAIEKAAIHRQLADQRIQLALKNEEIARHVGQLQQEVAERNRAETEAHAAVQQLRAVTDHLPISIAQFDREYRYRFANLYFTSRFGLTPESIVGKTVADVVGQELFDSYLEKMSAAQNGQRVHFETAVGLKWMSVTYVPERNAAGEVIGFVAVSADITERRQAEVEIGAARDQAVAATMARDNFLATLSHELRTPLNPVLLIASEAAENSSLTKEVREDFAAIRDHVELEARLIDDLLDLSRISHGKLTLQRRPLSLHSVLRSALAIVRPDFAEKKIRLKMDISLDDARLDADPVRLQQIFWNVLKNAAKFTPLGGTVAVESRMDQSQRKAIVRISDTGIGLSELELPKIFEAFAQGDHASRGGSHRFGGLGLGLAITRMLVEAHGGRITVASEGLDRGTTFTLELPAQPADVAAATLVAPTRLDAGPDQKISMKNEAVVQKQLLLIEDHASTRSSLALLLERRGFTVKTAGSVAEAVKLAEQFRFDLVISDIGLPDGDGYGCLQSLRNLQPTLPGIALSGYGMEDDRERSRVAGFVEHLIKPVNIQALERAIARTIEAER